MATALAILALQVDSELATSVLVALLVLLVARLVGPVRRRAAPLIITLVALAAASSAAAAPPAEPIRESVRALEGDHDSATRGVYALQRGGARAAAALRDAWPSMSPLAQRRAIAALRTLAEEHEAAVDALVMGARSHDESVREASLAALRRVPERGRDGLAALVGDAKVGDRAAALLARNEPDYAIAILLDAIDAEGGAERSALRDALAVAVERAARPSLPLKSWLEDEPSADAVASAAFGLRELDVPIPVMTSYVRYALAKPETFEKSWRLLQSAAAAGEDATIDAWIEEQLRVDDPWMIRAAAVDAAAARGFREAVRPRLSDPYPRVRMRAAAVLSGDAPSMLQRATLARKDTWPIVRAEALESLRSEPDALPVVVAAVNDSMSIVRASAIRVLVDAPHDEGWDRVHARLRASNEWPIVTEAAIAYVVAHCRTDAAESLFRVVMRAAPSSALTEDLNNAALAIEALRQLGTPDANAVIERLRAAPGVPPTLKMALDSPLPDEGRCAN